MSILQSWTNPIIRKGSTNWNSFLTKCLSLKGCYVGKWKWFVLKNQVVFIFAGTFQQTYTERISWQFFTALSVVIWFSTGTLGIFATLVYVFIMRVGIFDILSMAIIPKLSTSILFCNLCYILLWTWLGNISVQINKPTRVIIFAMLVAADATDDGYFSETVWHSHILIFIRRLP